MTKKLIGCHKNAVYNRVVRISLYNQFDRFEATRSAGSGMVIRIYSGRHNSGKHADVAMATDSA